MKREQVWSILPAMRRKWIVLALLMAGGCGVQRQMVMTSNPPGALVYLNGQEIGRTPLKHEFLW
ncbi:MAG TPA: PEGA domain-containing protein [Tepidisphaeraceae bacterium]|nr:PEGA domain-containing protein [Tepidisphaeraceae bacterium]